MTPSASAKPDKQPRFPGEIVRHAVWRSFRFPLSPRDGAERLVVRGVMGSHAAIRTWCRQCGQQAAHHRRRPRPGEQWPLDAVVITITKERRSLGQAGDHDGTVRDMLGHSRRNTQAAQTCFRTLLKGVTSVPRVIITDNLQRDGAAQRAILPGVEHRQPRSLNNRAENSHQPPRQREQRMQRVTSAGHAHRFLAASGPIAQHVRPRWPRLSAPEYRQARPHRCQVWGEITGTAMAS